MSEYPTNIPLCNHICVVDSHNNNNNNNNNNSYNNHNSGLIAKAILSTQERRMILSEIYQWIQLRYPYFSTRGPGWRNSIRHNLSLNDCFIKVGRAANGKGHYWGIHPANLKDFLSGDFRRRRAQRKVRRALGLTQLGDKDDDDLDEDDDDDQDHADDQDTPSPNPALMPQLFSSMDSYAPTYLTQSLIEKTPVQPNSTNKHTFNGKASHLPDTNTKIFTSNSLTNFPPNQYTQNLQSDVTTSLIINPLHFSLIHNSDYESYHKSLHSLCPKSQIGNPDELNQSLPTLNTIPQILKSNYNDTLMDLFYTNLMYLFKNHSPVKSDTDIFTSEKNLPTTSLTPTNTTSDPTNHLQNNVKYENLSYPSLNHVITTTQQLTNQQSVNVSFNVVNLIDPHLNHHDNIKDNDGILSTTESVHYDKESNDVSKFNVNYTKFQNEEAMKLMPCSTKSTNQSYLDNSNQIFTSSNTSNSLHSVDSPLDYTLCK
ncbi:hypothetical protein MN116_007696 [Schistosoma mekongi]|uniref:Fork-head domain-containing protein n=1 Tax=Schistosoma mekongi TaxID=38744 RepID=A0AAE1Z7U3_SCHME|nr:hypothetical protein MN116_007696 [Schistosoma mekongi]